MSIQIIYTVFGFIILSVIFGIYFFDILIKSKKIPLFSTFINGFLVISCLVLLLNYLLSGKPDALASFTILMIVATGGSILVYQNMTGKLIHRSFAVIHDLVAIIGFVLLITFTLEFLYK